MPYFRHRSFVFAPASASLSTPMICSSVNRRLFIRLLPDEQTLLHSGTNLGEQTRTCEDTALAKASRRVEFLKCLSSSANSVGGRSRFEKVWGRCETRTSSLTRALPATERPAALPSVSQSRSVAWSRL